MNSSVIFRTEIRSHKWFGHGGNCVDKKIADVNKSNYNIICLPFQNTRHVTLLHTYIRFYSETKLTLSLSNGPFHRSYFNKKTLSVVGQLEVPLPPFIRRI